MNETTMPFGKHKGRPLSDIPSDYLVWVMTKVRRLKFNLRMNIAAELNSRGVLQPESTVVSRNLGTGKLTRTFVRPRPW